jgi:hypothetical protein
MMKFASRFPSKFDIPCSIFIIQFFLDWKKLSENGGKVPAELLS